ncbi:AP2-like ethylene-responsive transcription factor CRL5 [Triticum urartu]|uniref:AP2-like ethylene-responsive transcription factor CRL5 n=1 Tax=Triticum urartu TaxID=4572 RepID=UPI0020443214|nr:AP2-like ethylene-responsive transcription factor CRL5 [Triticum urartu]
MAGSNRAREAFARAGEKAAGGPPRALLLATSPLRHFLRHHRATMSSRRRGASDFRGVRERPNGWYSIKIRAGDVWLGLGTFRSAREAARAYDAAAWRLERPRSQMNFRDVFTREEAQRVAPPPRLITDMDRADHSRRQRRLLVAEEDERAMAEWRRRHPEDVDAERAYWVERTARRRSERADRRQRKAVANEQCDIISAGGRSFFTSDDERWDDIWLSTSDDTDENDDGDGSDLE